MTKKRKLVPGNDDLELNLTPMIDVVFNLVVFFMIVIDLTQKEKEILRLPWSAAAVEEIDPDELRVIINIQKADPDNWEPGGPVEILIKRLPYDLDSLKLELGRMADRKRDLTHEAQPSEIFVLIRCDQDIRWREVQWVMQACADPEVRIYKLQFATRRPDDAP